MVKFSGALGAGREGENVILVICPGCGETLETDFDLSEGPPTEAGIECDNCEGIPVFEVIASWFVTLGPFLRWEREPPDPGDDPPGPGTIKAIRGLIVDLDGE